MEQGSQETFRRTRIDSTGSELLPFTKFLTDYFDRGWFQFRPSQIKMSVDIDQVVVQVGLSVYRYRLDPAVATLLDQESRKVRKQSWSDVLERLKSNFLEKES